MYYIFRRCVMSKQQPSLSKTGKKHVMSRLWAVILTVAPIVVLCLLPTYLFLGVGFSTEHTLLEAFVELFGQIFGKDKGFEEIFGVLPLLTNYPFFGEIYSVALYLLPVAMLVSVILMIVAIFSGKKAPTLARAIAFINVFVYGTYALGMLFLSKYLVLDIDLTTTAGYALAGIIGASLLVYLAYAFARVKKATFVNILLMIFSLVFVGGLVYSYFFVEEAFWLFNVMRVVKEDSFLPFLTVSQLSTYLFYAVGAFSVLHLFVSGIRLSTRKGLGFDIFRNIVALILAGVIVATAFLQEGVKELAFMDFALFPILSLIVALLSIIVASTAKSKKKKAILAYKQSAEKEAVPAVEEYAVAEDPECISELLPSEENLIEEQPAVSEEPVAETVAPAEEKVEPTPYKEFHYFENKNFDPFMTLLTDAERKEFTEVFLLKYKGETTNLPDYVVGGDNASFFRKIFIYVGQYREKISPELLAKMYNFLMKK